MAVYLCSRCDRYVDGDYTPCVEDPKSKNFEVMCCDHEDEASSEFTPEQEAIIQNLKSQDECHNCGHGGEHHKHADACRFETCQCKRYE